MEIINPNGVKVYNLSCGKPIPDFLSKKKRKELAKDESYRTRIELIQGFEFNSACNKIKISKDGQFIIASGVYPPMIRCYETSQLSQKFQRNVDSEIAQLQILTEDYSKIALLQMDRSVEIHARYGYHYKTRIPKYGRDMTYNKTNCELVIGGNTNEIYRLDLEQGCFVTPFQTSCTSINKIGLSDVHQLYAFGSENGILECWDPRVRKCISSLQIFDTEISYLRYSNDGLNIALGSKDGVVKLYDLRSPTAYQTISHQYETPITGIKYSNDYIITSDKKTFKIHNYKTNKPLVTVEAPADINHISHIPNTGLIMLACEQPKVMSYFVPELGQAPKWCSFLDNLTEELEETKSSNFEDYKFVTRQELTQLGLDHLIGTDLLRAYMHGFFMDNRLYQRVKSVAEPFTYDEWKKSQHKKAIEEKKAQRINIRTKQHKVNQELADTLSKDNTSSGLLQDSRFKAMFENNEYQIDEESEEFKRLHPSGRKHIDEYGNEEIDDINEENNENDDINEDFDLLDEKINDNEDEDEDENNNDEDSDEDNDTDNEMIDSDDDNKNKNRKNNHNYTRNNTKRRNNIKFFGIKNDGKLPQGGISRNISRKIANRKKQQTNLPFNKRIH